MVLSFVMERKVSVDLSGSTMLTGMRLDTLGMKGMMLISENVFRIETVLNPLSKLTLHAIPKTAMMMASLTALTMLLYTRLDRLNAPKIGSMIPNSGPLSKTVLDSTSGAKDDALQPSSRKYTFHVFQ